MGVIPLAQGSRWRATDSNVVRIYTILSHEDRIHTKLKKFKENVLGWKLRSKGEDEIWE